MTFELTNAAPQWQAVNNGVWKELEMKVRDYVNHGDRELYIISGTGKLISVTTLFVTKLIWIHIEQCAALAIK